MIGILKITLQIQFLTEKNFCFKMQWLPLVLTVTQLSKILWSVIVINLNTSTSWHLILTPRTNYSPAYNSSHMVWNRQNHIFALGTFYYMEQFVFHQYFTKVTILYWQLHFPFQRTRPTSLQLDKTKTIQVFLLLWGWSVSTLCIIYIYLIWNQQQLNAQCANYLLLKLWVVRWREWEGTGNSQIMLM